MMANRAGIGPVILATALALLSGCVAAPTASPPAPQPSPVVLTLPPPVRAIPAPTDWQDVPATPGDWHWSNEAGTSTARFAEGLLILRCDPPRHAVTLLRAAPLTLGESVLMTIETTSTTRALSADPAPGGVAVTLDARNPLLDAIAFSRGRFAIETTGQPTLYVPSWSEVGRVIEDCR